MGETLQEHIVQIGFLGYFAEVLQSGKDVGVALRAVELGLYLLHLLSEVSSLLLNGQHLLDYFSLVGIRELLFLAVKLDQTLDVLDGDALKSLSGLLDLIVDGGGGEAVVDEGREDFEADGSEREDVLVDDGFEIGEDLGKAARHGRTVGGAELREQTPQLGQQGLVLLTLHTLPHLFELHLSHLVDLQNQRQEVLRVELESGVDFQMLGH